MSLNLWDYAPEDLEVTVSELLIATAASSDALIDDAVREVLHELRQHLGMDVIFLSEIRGASACSSTSMPGPAPKSSPREAARRSNNRFASLCWTAACRAWCTTPPRTRQRRSCRPRHFALARTSAHPSCWPTGDGRVYGTLCSFSCAGDESLSEKDLGKLECVARVAAKRIDTRLRNGGDAELAAWQAPSGGA